MNFLRILLPKRGPNPLNVSTAAKIEWVHDQIDRLERGAAIDGGLHFKTGMSSSACVGLISQSCAESGIEEIPPRAALLSLAQECGNVDDDHVDALNDEEFAAFNHAVLSMALDAIASSFAREWIERLHVEEPSKARLTDLHMLLHTRQHHRLVWVRSFVEQHGVDALCIWLHRLQGGGSQCTPDGGACGSLSVSTRAHLLADAEATEVGEAAEVEEAF